MRITTLHLATLLAGIVHEFVERARGLGFSEDEIIKALGGALPLGGTEVT